MIEDIGQLLFDQKDRITMKNLLISIFVLMFTCLSTSIGLAVTDKNQLTEKAKEEHTTHKETFNHSHTLTVNSYVVNVGRGATYFGISKKLAKISGTDWSWDLVDRVELSHQLKYQGEILKPKQKFSVNL